MDFKFLIFISKKSLFVRYLFKESSWFDNLGLKDYGGETFVSE